VTSGDCNKCIAENQVGFCYELLMRGNDKLCMSSSLYAKKKIALADCIHAFRIAGEKQNILHLYCQSSLQPQYCDRMCPSDITNTKQHGWGGGGLVAGLPP
jgi:hypothetical protein